MIALTVSVPVGPRESHRKWLGDCIESITGQFDHTNDELFLIFDSREKPRCRYNDKVRTFTNGISLGVTACVNLGVAWAYNDHVLFMNSDDILLPGALEAVRRAWETYRDQHGWYYLNTVYSNGNEQKTPSGVAMVYKNYFLSLGGYPAESVVGFPDWMFLSLAQTRGFITPYSVSDKCYHWHRIHDEQETKIRKLAWNNAASIVHETLQRTWKK